MQRRDLLKYFGIGTIIAPVGGATIKAELLEVPKIQPIETPRILRPLNLRQVQSATLTLKMRDGTERMLSLTDLYAKGDSIFSAVPVSVAVRISEDLNTSPMVSVVAGELRGTGEFL